VRKAAVSVALLALGVIAGASVLGLGAAGAAQRVSVVLTVRIPKSGAPWLTDISCATVRDCVAADGTVVEATLDGGTRWIRESVAPHYWVDEVSCTATGACRGLGLRKGSYQRFMIDDAHSEWVASSGDVDELEPTAVSELSCPSSSECVAVGANNLIGGNANGYPVWLSTDLGGGTASPLATWRRSLIPFRHGSIIVGLASVDCPTTVTCYALADSYDAGALLLATSTRAASWRIVRVSQGGRVPVKELTNSHFSNVSCATTTSCTVVGVGPSGQLLILTTTDGGSSWRWTSAPSARGGASEYGPPTVSCSSSNVCEVAYERTLLRSTDGGRHWARTVLVKGDGFLYSLSCPSDTRCFATTLVPVGRDGQITGFGVGHVLRVKAAQGS